MIKRLLCAVIAICMLFSLCSCKKAANTDNPEPSGEEISFISVLLGDKFLDEWKECGTRTVEWNKLKLSEEDEKKFPKLKNVFDKYNNESLKDAKALMYELEGAFELLEADESNPLHLEGKSEVFIQRADTMIVSFLEDVFVHSGGVHPEYHYITKNFDPKTGEELILTDVVPVIKGLPDILEGKITKKYDYIPFQENQLWTIFSEYSPTDYNWTLDYQGITFWFSPYDIAAYAAGPLSIKIFFDEEPYIFSEEYKKAPSENYSIMLPDRQKIDFDLHPDDDNHDHIEVYETPDAYGSYNMLSVTVNGKTFTDEINYAYGFDNYLARIDGKSYIYSDSVSDNDYHMLCTWDINGDTPALIHELHGTEIDYEYIEEGFEDGTVYRKAFTNPNSFVLEERFDILGTRGATASYKINEADGIPVMTDKVYTFNYGQDVKTKISIEAEALPDMKKTTIPEGTTLIPYQTDGKTFVDLKTEDGKILRITIEASGWPKTVNNIPEDECFEDLMYAG